MCDLISELILVEHEILRGGLGCVKHARLSNARASLERL